MRFGLVLCNHPAASESLNLFFKDQIEQVRLAERLGGHTALVCEHHFEGDHLPSPLIAATALAYSTSKIRVGTGILLLALYNPLRVAEDGATLDAITGGRLVLGVGHGYRPEEFAGYSIPLNQRFSRVEEGAKVIRAVWSDPKASFSGKYFKFDNITIAPRPHQKPHPPIWVAAKAEAAVKQAARIGDAWFSDPVTPLSVLDERYKVYKETRRSLGKEFEKIERPLFREVYVSEKDDQEAWNDVKQYGLVTYGEYYKWGHFLDESGRAVDPSNASFAEFEDKLMDRFVVGNPSQCAEKLARIQRRLGITEVLCRMQFPNMPHRMVMDSIRLLGEKVMPQLQN
jgi:alkanesulfonate monooxygenase SsuD/methylene tetrahydromethanopterin reductase-like flavin-dependent oxidoreductase (luciferase family)